MKYKVELISDREIDGVEVTVVANSKTAQVQDFLTYLDNYQQLTNEVLPIKHNDQLRMIKVDDIILAEITGTQLTLYTLVGNFEIREALNQFKRRLGRPYFIQVSKQAVLNINHLLSLSDSFSGSMTAKLVAGNKTSVSRKYVKDLMVYLGL